MMSKCPTCKWFNETGGCKKVEYSPFLHSFVVIRDDSDKKYMKNFCEDYTEKETKINWMEFIQRKELMDGRRRER